MMPTSVILPLSMLDLANSKCQPPVQARVLPAHSEIVTTLIALMSAFARPNTRS
jgi:hypothetical protein